MLSLDLSPSYWWPVKFHLPREDGSGHDLATFRGKFKRLDTEQIKSLQDEVLSKGLSDNEIARRLLVGWDEVSTGAGQSVEFNGATFERALKIPNFGTGVFSAWTESLAKGPEKNS